MRDVVFATRNPAKLREMQVLLRGIGVRLRSLADFPPTPPVNETGRTFEANAIKKAVAAARDTGCLAIADDSGLDVDALGGAPGVRSARFAGRHGDDQANNAKLLRLLARVPEARRGARFRCVLAVAGPRGVLGVTEGVLAGRIATQPRGRNGFGYDPLFVVPRLGNTTAELSSAAKHRISHRGQAARRLRRRLPGWLRQAARQRMESNKCCSPAGRS